MTIEQTDVVDFITIDRASGDIILTISDHLAWDENEGQHLLLLQEKLESYGRFIEGGELRRRCPDARDRKIVVNIVGKFPPSENATKLIYSAARMIGNVGCDVRFELFQPN